MEDIEQAGECGVRSAKCRVNKGGQQGAGNGNGAPGIRPDCIGTHPRAFNGSRSPSGRG